MRRSPPETPLTDLLWPVGRWQDAVREILLRSGLPTLPACVRRLPPEHLEAERLRWLHHAARDLGFEGYVETVDSGRLASGPAAPGPYLVLVEDVAAQSVSALAMLRRRGGSPLAAPHYVIVRPDGGEETLSWKVLSSKLTRSRGSDEDLASVFEGLPGGAKSLQRLLASRDDRSRSFTIVSYQLDAAQPFYEQLKQRGILKKLIAYVMLSAVQGVVAALAAFTLGAAALTGVVDLSRVIAWSLLAASSVPLQYINVGVLGQTTLDVAVVMKKRLLEGALVTDDEGLRAQGFGVLIARLNEASVVEQLNLTQLFGILAPLGQLLAGLVLLSWGTLAQVHLPLAAAFLIGAVILGLHFDRRYRSTYQTRLSLTQDLVEKVIGHRTRAVQANPEHLHDEEDDQLCGYANQLLALNQSTTASDIYSRLGMLASGGVLLFSFITGEEGAALLPTAIGIYLTYQSFGALLAVGRGVSIWSCAWQGVKALFVAGGPRSRPSPAAGASDETGRTTVLSSVSFAYRARPIFADANLRIAAGERVLVTGPSGGGKTTLSKLLTGELQPSNGSILINGVDRASVSEQSWRQRVVSSPQFHENYVFSNTLGFNIDPHGLEGELSPEARAVCSELGLRELLGKMPSRAAQIVGETGWQLSHGERSRVFIARSLLQGADVLIFDESFAALDPETLELVLECVRRRAQTLIAIAHQ